MFKTLTLVYVISLYKLDMDQLPKWFENVFFAQKLQAVKTLNYNFVFEVLLCF